MRSNVARAAFAALVLSAFSIAEAQQPAAKRPLTFLDMQQFRQAGSPTPSPDRKWMLYTISTPDWKEAKRQTDIYVVSMTDGVASTKQLTFTKEKNESAPRWSRDGSYFAFLSNRDAPASSATQNQVYVMRTDGGESRQITTAKEGVSNFAFSPDGKWLTYRSGKSGEEQLYIVPTSNLDSAKAVQLTKQLAGVGTWEWSPDNKRIFFITEDTADADEKQRREKKFTVNVRNPESPLSSLYVVDVDAKKTTRLTKDTTITVSQINISPDGKWVGFRGTSADRYKRGITESGINSDL
ncbi:MAG TPA: hypothetical protein VGD49_03650 [Longimicrobiales bacterium]